MPAGSGARPPDQEDIAGGVEEEARGAEHALTQPLLPQAEQARDGRALLQDLEGGVCAQQRPRHGIILQWGVQNKRREIDRRLLRV